MAVVEKPDEWSVQHTPAAAAAATISVAAQTRGIHHVTSITISLGGTAATTAGLSFNLRDSTTGAGNILWSVKLANLANTTNTFSVGGINIVGVKGQAVTLESASAPGANVSATVAMTGYTEVLPV